jgi:hypothetical protein
VFCFTLLAKALLTEVNFLSAGLGLLPKPTPLPELTSHPADDVERGAARPGGPGRAKRKR